MDTEQSKQLVDGAIAQVKAATQNLQALVIEQSLCSEYQDRTQALNEEARQIESERETLSASRSKLEVIAEGKVKVLERASDELAAEGDIAGAAAKIEESRAVRKNFDSIGERIGLIDERRKAIVEERERVAREVWQQGYLNLPVASFAVIESCVDFLDGMQAGMYQYQKLVGLEAGSFGDRPLVTRPHIEKLTPLPNGPERFLASRVRKWF